MLGERSLTHIVCIAAVTVAPRGVAVTVIGLFFFAIFQQSVKDERKIWRFGSQRMFDVKIRP
jgi:hypothetical protein